MSRLTCSGCKQVTAMELGIKHTYNTSFIKTKNGLALISTCQRLKCEWIKKSSMVHNITAKQINKHGV